jgi:hypothetical protein
MDVRALMSGIFAHAVAEGRLNVNPIRDARRRVQAKPSKRTEHYDSLPKYSLQLPRLMDIHRHSLLLRWAPLLVFAAQRFPACSGAT